MKIEVVSEMFYTQNSKLYKWRELVYEWPEPLTKRRELVNEWPEPLTERREIVNECPEQHVDSKLAFMNNYGTHKNSGTHISHEYIYHLPRLMLESPSRRSYVSYYDRSNQHKSWIFQLLCGCEYISPTTNKCRADVSKLAYNHCTPVSTLSGSLSPWDKNLSYEHAWVQARH